MTDQAPFFSDVDEGPAGGQAVWCTAADGVRIRVGWWPVASDVTGKGTVLIFPGRTEYIEKYGRDAVDLTAAGYTVLAIDWRGQGLADRTMDNVNIGHVGSFPDYQLDVGAALDVAQTADLPKPWHLLGHSMGGCIGLRALHEGLPVASAIFSAPMWGIQLKAAVRPVAWGIARVGSHLGLGNMMSPGMKEAPYPLEFSFKANKLTSDRDFYDYMRRQLTRHPELSLGGPSLHWLNLALAECRDLMQRAAPDVHALTFLGVDEAIVDSDQIKARMESWPVGELVMLPAGRHEVLMETPAVRQAVFARMIPFLDKHGGTEQSRTA
jgi:lysophospholipase